VEGLAQMGGGAGTTAGYLIKQKKFVIIVLQGNTKQRFRENNFFEC